MAIIFTDGFETGDLTRWSSSSNSVGETVAASQEQQHHVSWSVKCTTNGGGGAEYARVTRSGLNLASFYARAYVYVGTNGIDAASDYLSFFTAYNAANTLLNIGWYSNGGVLSWWLRSRHATGYSSVYSVAATRNTGEWYCVEVYWENAAAANVYGWVNGSNILSLAARDTNDYGNATIIHFGLPYCNNVAASVLYGDCAVIADTYIGPENPKLRSKLPFEVTTMLNNKVLYG